MKIRYVLLSTVLCLVFAASYIARPTAAQGAPKRIEVTASKFKYEPSEVTVKKGEPVVIVLKSTDVAHGIKFKELNLQAKVDKGGTGELAFTPDKTGDYVGHCSVFCGAGHGSMTLTLHVTE
ncbi:cupredoxin domain-containing protein [Granulicella tundricola]|uniref:Cytochrome c oxidase subunit II n=1 Tax=Granulicella tundricola (strain ATCC BAA-1859 / DSM 23138 / MP5ACTX9) TaxID=1198114 RepID=E8WZ59_GRATM|nr:cupredoxin domain-containing protein [Granulicella tundricola]ADW67661.1 cytochrome c oxidase subunit II [Granulicella tundricola MP5ACTX9]